MQITLFDHYRMLARYNSGANRRLYDSCAELTEEDMRRDRAAFFGSILGTLNHILVGDRIWLTRFAGGVVPSTDLDALLFDDFAALRQAREAQDREIEEFFGALDADMFERDIAYRNNEGRDLSDPAWVLMAHFFNHQTHHRGQVHDMLSQAGIDTPVLDMHRVIYP